MGLAAVCAGRRRPAREIATRELRSEWSISRPALALPPPTSTAAWPSGPSGALHTSGACCAEYDSPRLEARLAPPPPTSTAAWPSGPSGALDTGGACGADVWLGASARSLATAVN